MTMPFWVDYVLVLFLLVVLSSFVHLYCTVLKERVSLDRKRKETYKQLEFFDNDDFDSFM